MGAAKKSEERATARKASVLKRREVIKKARAYDHEYKKAEKSLVAQQRAAKAQGNYFVADQPRLAVVTRIRGINQISPKPKKVLQLLRLRQIGNTVFVRLNKSSIQMLRMADPFIAWGYPTQETISKMIYKRGAGNINGQRMKLSCNSIIEKGLGHIGITCIEDF